MYDHLNDLSLRSIKIQVIEQVRMVDFDEKHPP